MIDDDTSTSSEDEGADHGEVVQASPGERIFLVAVDQTEEMIPLAIDEDDGKETILNELIRAEEHYAKKIHSVRNNAEFVRQIKEDHGSFAGWIADWPVTEIVDLWAELKQRAATGFVAGGDV